MLTQLSATPVGGLPLRSLRTERGLWHDANTKTPSLGCSACFDRDICGGLHIDQPVFDCLEFCCGRPGDCDAVCRKSPREFARRVVEVSGFGLQNVPRAKPLPPPALPLVVPVLAHGHKRSGTFDAQAVCLPLYDVIKRHDGSIRYKDHRQLVEGFRFSPSANVVLTGTATDPDIERWWSLDIRRRERIRDMVDLGVSIVTTPNFSLFTDRPRWDDLHSMKRIALVHEEFLSEHLPAALHVNARTDRDWSRWRDYIRVRSEVTHIAFEFATGAGYPSRLPWHTDQLLRLADSSPQKLHLIVRGGLKSLPALRSAFAGITLLETSTFSKTRNRQIALMSPNGKLKWRSNPTAEGHPLDDLLAENWRTVEAYYRRLFGREVSSGAGE